MQNSDTEKDLIHLRLTVDPEMGGVYDHLLATKRRAREAIYLMRLGAMYVQQLKDAGGSVSSLYVAGTDTDHPAPPLASLSALASERAATTSSATSVEMQKHFADFPLDFFSGPPK